MFDMLQTVGPINSLRGLTGNHVNTVHSCLHSSTLPSSIRFVLSASSIGMCLWIFCFFFSFDDEEPYQGKALRTHLWVLNLGYTTPPAKTVYLVIQEKLLVGIKPRMSGSIAHPKGRLIIILP